jgi:hypothetical protein
VVIDDEIHAVDHLSEVVGLHVHHRNALVIDDLRRGNRLDVQVEKVDHAHVLGAGDAFQRRDDAGLARAPQHVAQRQAARKRVGIRLIVQEDEHAVGITEEPLVLLHSQPCQRSAELGQ